MATNDKPYYKFYFLNELGEYMVFVNGVVTSTTTPTEIEAPVGWDKTQIKYTRSQTYLGLVRALTTTYKFPFTGGSILRYLNATQGIEAYCKFKITIVDQTGATWNYVDFAEFGIDFSTYEDLEFLDDGGILPVVSVNAAEDGVYKVIRDSENVNYEIPIGIDGTFFNLDGVRLDSEYDFAPSAGGISLLQNVTVVQLIPSRVYFTERGAYTSASARTQGALLSNTFQTNPARTVGATMDVNVYDDYALYALYDGSLAAITETANVTLNNSGSSPGSPVTFRVRVIVANTSKVITQAIDIFTYPVVAPISPGSSATFDVTASTTGIAMNKDDRLFVFYEVTRGNTNTADYSLSWLGNPSNQQIYKTIVSIAFTRPTTYSIGYRYYQFLSKGIKKMSNNVYDGVSSFLSSAATNVLDSKPYNIIVTCSGALRLVIDSKIRFKLSECFQDLKSLYSMGLGTDNNGNVRIEPLSFFFDKNTQIADLGVVDCTIKYATDLFYNDIKVGYQDNTYDEINGRNSVNAGQEYKMPLSRIAKESDLISPYRADDYGAEYERSNLINKKTIDTSTTNDVWLFDIANTTSGPIAAYDLRRGGTITGLPYSSSNYNLSLTPKRRLLRNKAWIASLLFGRPATAKVTFQTADKNAKVTSDLGSGTISENADVTVSSLGTALVQPYFFYVRSTVALNTQSLLAATPNGYYDFIQAQTGEAFKGFLWEVAITPADNPIYDYIFIGHPDNDMIKTVF